MEDGVRVKLDLSDFLSGIDSFRWVHLPFDRYKSINDLQNFIIQTYKVDVKRELNLFIEEPFHLHSKENIKILKNGDLIIVKLASAQSSLASSTIPPKSQSQAEPSVDKSDIEAVTSPMKKKRKRKRKKEQQADAEELVIVQQDQTIHQQELNTKEPNFQEACVDKCEAVTCEDLLRVPEKAASMDKFSNLLNLASKRPKVVSRCESPAKKAEHQAYEKMKPLVGIPSIGQIVAFKILELDSNLSPNLSDYKEGTVETVREDGIVTLALQKGEMDDCEVQWCRVIDAKLIN